MYLSDARARPTTSGFSCHPCDSSPSGFGTSGERRQTSTTNRPPALRMGRNCEARMDSSQDCTCQADRTRNWNGAAAEAY
jgi:hypothetical protein